MEKTDCGWSGTQQQHSRNETTTKLWLERRYDNHTTTKRTMEQKDVKTFEFSEYHENEENSR